MSRPFTPPTVRFWAKVNKAGPVPPFNPRLGNCWLWTGGRTQRDYGCFWDGKRLVMAHRFSYEDAVAPIPARLQIDHLCRVHSCVRPTHLEPVTNAENIRRGFPRNGNELKRHCPKGHPYDGTNTVLKIRHDRGGVAERHCRLCRNASTSARNKRNHVHLAKLSRERRARLKVMR